MPKITREEIEAARTPAGGWTRRQLAQWGVPWPPPKGWKARLLAHQSSEPDDGPIPEDLTRTKFPFIAKINGVERTVWPDWIE